MRKIYFNGLNLSGDGHDHYEIIIKDVLKQSVHEISDTNKNDLGINNIIRNSLGNLTSSLLTGKPTADHDWKLIFDFIEGVNFWHPLEMLLCTSLCQGNSGTIL